MASATKDTMLSKRCPNGPGGRDCPCCGDKPGKSRTAPAGEPSAPNAAAGRRP